MRVDPLNTGASDFIHLCQPDGGKSCGACCGLYNYADSSRASLTARLARRTARYHATVRRPEDLAAFAAWVRETEDMTKRYEVIHCCEYLGFLDDDRRRVGCLLHPLQNAGEDRRDVSFYGRELCDGHFCPSYHFLSRPEKLALLYALDDWYLYGLCLTDIDLVKEWFRFVSDAVFETPDPERFRSGPFRDIARAYFAFKLDWPFRDDAVNRLGKYYFDGSQYMIRHIDYDALGMPRSRFDKIFLSLTSTFRDAGEVRRAETLIQDTIDAFVRVYARA